ncbi:MAG: class I SAM-dependent methyltransferase [Saprospiraceae bacterium]
MSATQNYVPALRYPWLTRWYDAIMARMFPETLVRVALIDSADIQKGHRILEFGVGTASLSIMLKQIHRLPELVGVDVDPEVLRIARQKIEKSDVSVGIVQYDGSILPFADQSFDRVVTCLVLHHLDPEQKRQSLREMRRVLKPDGSLHVADWGKPSNWRMRLAFYAVQWLDGFKTTTENVRGLLPDIFQETGFLTVQEGDKVDTIFGTMRIYSVYGEKSLTNQNPPFPIQNN